MSVTMSDIAARAGTTVGVVSVTLNGAKSKTLRVSEATKARVLSAAAELGYRRDPRASALVTGRNFVVGLMLPHLNSFTYPDPFYSLLTAGVAASASRLGYNLMLYTAVAEEESDRAIQMIDRRIDGLILVMPPVGTPIIEECRKQGIATISVLQTSDHSPMTVNSSDYEGGRLATQHLVDLGHRRIAHLFGNPEVVTTNPRQRGYLDVLRENDITPDPRWIEDGSFDRGKGLASTRRLLDLPHEVRPTAIFAANDPSAHGAVDAIVERRLSVPDDISVIGYDDSWYATMVVPALTTVALNADAMGSRAVQTLIDAIEGADPEPHVVLPVSLTNRSSTAPPRF